MFKPNRVKKATGKPKKAQPDWKASTFKDLCLSDLSSISDTDTEMQEIFKQTQMEKPNAVESKSQPVQKLRNKKTKLKPGRPNKKEKTLFTKRGRKPKKSLEEQLRALKEQLSALDADEARQREERNKLVPDAKEVQENPDFETQDKASGDTITTTDKPNNAADEKIQENVVENNFSSNDEFLCILDTSQDDNTDPANQQQKPVKIIIKKKPSASIPCVEDPKTNQAIEFYKNQFLAKKVRKPKAMKKASSGNKRGRPPKHSAKQNKIPKVPKTLPKKHSLAFIDLGTYDSDTDPASDEELESLITATDWNEERRWIKTTVQPYVDKGLQALPTSEEIWSNYDAMKSGKDVPKWPLTCLVQTGPLEQNATVTKLSPENKEDLANREPKQPLHIQSLEQVDEAVQWLVDDAQRESAPLHYFSEDLEDESDRSVSPDSDYDFMNLEVINNNVDLDPNELASWANEERLFEPLIDVDYIECLLELAGNHNHRGLVKLLNTNLVNNEELIKANEKLNQEMLQEHYQPNEIEINDDICASPNLPDAVDEIVIDYSAELPETAMECLEIEDDSEADEVCQNNKTEPQSPIDLIMSSADIEETAETYEDNAVVDTILQLLMPKMHAAAKKLKPQNAPSTMDLTQEPAKSNTQGSKSAITDWMNSFDNMLTSFDEAVEHKMTEYRNPLGKRERSKPNSTNSEKLERYLFVPNMPTHLELQEQLRRKDIPIMRRQPRSSSKLTIHMRFIRLFCTFDVHNFLDLKKTAKMLENADYNSDVDVVRKRYEASQMAWIWRNGSVMIINGPNRASLTTAQKIMVSQILGVQYLDAISKKDILYFRYMACTSFPWRIRISSFSKYYAYTEKSQYGFNNFVYYADKTIPYAVARVYMTGLIHVFAPSPGIADNMIKKLYCLTAHHRVTDDAADEYKPTEESLKTRKKRKNMPQEDNCCITDDEEN